MKQSRTFLFSIILPVVSRDSSSIGHPDPSTSSGQGPPKDLAEPGEYVLWAQILRQADGNGDFRYKLAMLTTFSCHPRK